MKKYPTIRDVAREAGVSTATVSFVINNNAGQTIGVNARKRVLQAAERLEYSPLASASELARKRTHNVTVLLREDSRCGSNVLLGAIREATLRDYNLTLSLAQSDYHGFGDLPRAIRERNTEGVLTLQHVCPEMIHDIQTRKIPVVAVDCDPVVSGIVAIHTDNRGGGAKLAEHLVELGHRRIAIITGQEDQDSLDERVGGFLEAASKRGVHLPWQECIARGTSPTFAEGYRVATALLTSKPRPTAVFCVTDEMAAGVLRAAHKLGVHVPHELSVVGYGVAMLGAFVEPALTTVAANAEELGGRAISCLLDCVESGEQRVFREEVRVNLVVRDSTGPASS